jgi:hypothetical protein
MWILIGLSVVGATAAALNWLQVRGRKRDLGVVSNLWLAQARHAQTQDSRR